MNLNPDILLGEGSEDRPTRATAAKEFMQTIGTMRSAMINDYRGDDRKAFLDKVKEIELRRKASAQK